MPRSFKAFCPKNAKILILGTMPGAASLKEQEYYAHPQNKFWDIIFDIFEQKPRPANYSAKLACLQKNKIALWDNLAYCARQSSLDGSIKNDRPNNIPLLLKNNKSIKKIILNGKTSFKFFNKHFGGFEGAQHFVLPSTSPAHARMNYKQKLAAWERMLKDL